MSYVYNVSAISYAGETHQPSDEFFYADKLTSVCDDVCSTSFQKAKCKGRKHLFSVSTCTESAEMLCKYLSKLLVKRTNEKIRIKIQYSLKNAVDEITEVYSDGRETDMSMLYVDEENVYAAGNGDISIYHYDKRNGRAEAVDFPVSPLSTDGETDEILGIKNDKRTHARYVTSVFEGDEYLVVGKVVKNILGDSEICKILSSQPSECVQILSDLARQKDSSRTISLVHIAVKKSISLLLGLGIGAILLLALLLIIIL